MCWLYRRDQIFSLLRSACQVAAAGLQLTTDMATGAVQSGDVVACGRLAAAAIEAGAALIDVTLRQDQGQQQGLGSADAIMLVRLVPMAALGLLRVFAKQQGATVSMVFLKPSMLLAHAAGCLTLRCAQRQQQRDPQLLAGAACCPALPHSSSPALTSCHAAGTANTTQLHRSTRAIKAQLIKHNTPSCAPC